MKYYIHERSVSSCVPNRLNILCSCNVTLVRQFQYVPDCTGHKKRRNCHPSLWELLGTRTQYIAIDSSCAIKLHHS